VARDDGVSLSVPDYAFMRALPHDLTHYVVEMTLGLARGFWGSVAEGAKFGGMVLIEGRQKPHLKEKAKATVKLMLPTSTRRRFWYPSLRGLWTAASTGTGN
jgi:hypothetical protein